EGGGQGACAVEGGLPQRIELDAKPAVRFRVGVFETRGRSGYFLLRVSQADAGLEHDKTFNPARSAIFELVDAGIVEGLLHGDGNPELKGVADESAVKAFRGYADDGVGHAVEHLGLANNEGVAAEAVLPGTVTDDHHGMGVAAEIVFG